MRGKCQLLFQDKIYFDSFHKDLWLVALLPMPGKFSDDLQRIGYSPRRALKVLKLCFQVIKWLITISACASHSTG